MLTTMLEHLMARLDSDPAAIAVRRVTGADITRGHLARHIQHCAALAATADFAVRPVGEPAGRVGAADHGGPPGLSGWDRGTVWVGAADPYLMLVATMGCLHVGPTAVMEVSGPPAMFDRLAEACPPGMVICDDAESDLARWAVARNCGTRLVEHGNLDPVAGRPPAADGGAPLRFFTSGTTGAPKCVGVGAFPLLAAVRAVASRLELTTADTALSVAPLTHVLGLVTSVLAPLVSGGSVAFADPRHPRDFVTALPRLRPTWSAASPSAHQLIHRLITSAGAEPPAGLRLLRTASAPIAADVVRRLEDFYQVPLLNAYAMTEAPGEIASQTPHDRRAGTVGRPSLCEVDIRIAGRSAPAGAEGDVWVRGPNVVPTTGWMATGDVGLVDRDGFLRLTGRRDDIINHGGLKVWPPDVEAVALADPTVHTAVAFPIPDRSLGEAVGLAVVAVEGATVDRALLRRRLSSALPHHALPSTIVVCAEIPRNQRGKLQRRSLWRLLPGVRVDAALTATVRGS